MNNTAEIMERGIACLLERLGTIETERFIATVIREQFDYTKWRREYFGDASVQELNEAAAHYAQAHPFTPKNLSDTPVLKRKCGTIIVLLL